MLSVKFIVTSVVFAVLPDTHVVSSLFKLKSQRAKLFEDIWGNLSHGHDLFHRHCVCTYGILQIHHLFFFCSMFWMHSPLYMGFHSVSYSLWQQWFHFYSFCDNVNEINRALVAHTNEHCNSNRKVRSSISKALNALYINLD